MALSELEEGFLTQAVVAVTNHDDRPFQQRYAGVMYRIPPGATRSIPYHAAVLWFGDPRATNEEGGGPYKQHRAKEVDRLSTWYGNYGDPFYSEQPRTVTVGPGDSNEATPYRRNPIRAMGGTDDARFTFAHPHLPFVTVTELGEDTPVNVVINNPDDDRFDTIEGDTSADAQLAMMANVQAMVNSEMAKLADMIEGTDPGKAAEIRAAFTRDALPTIPSASLQPITATDDEADAFTEAVTDDAIDPTFIADADLPGPTVDGAPTPAATITPRPTTRTTTPKRKA